MRPLEMEFASRARLMVIGLLIGFPLMGLVVRRWTAILLPLIGWPLFYVGLNEGWWGYGTGDGWRYVAAVLSRRHLHRHRVGRGTVTFTVSADGTAVSSFSAQDFGGPSCTSSADASNLAITDHSFSQTTALQSITGSFPSLLNASGTVRVSFICDTGTVSWSATCSAACDTLDGYARPQSATPVRVSLVPAYTQCDEASANRVHGGPDPFDKPSCNPPTQTSPNVTVGTADANGQRTNSVGFVRLSVKAGDLGTPADEADVVMIARVTDVRNASDLSDYTGELEVRGSVRITDKLNSTSLTEPGTVEDATFPVTVPCVATASTTIGATCSVTTSYDAVVPGAITEGKHTIWELDQVLVNDGGPDGDADTSDDNAVFLRQGIFVP